ncbi:hypothetical protein GNI_110030 [Gregarina niphandrodes]|uniref:Uncharacterized protein n=1 Tax=Gregarina niphandrodes TaxID=110365 RepID=A0A023B3Y8_GRENI|nr:hypothetical protein GNI_110030 [Gregarina niphandrodes]EZG55668.1 hypothetical protein GNI_110030 [Gregarina niphandrodes]|eukprot:XP_011131469.1 hypothetical protein GNI_110030 [Gregarina niphandrodes]
MRGLESKVGVCDEGLIWMAMDTLTCGDGWVSLIEAFDACRDGDELRDADGEEEEDWSGEYGDSDVCREELSDGRLVEYKALRVEEAAVVRRLMASRWSGECKVSRYHTNVMEYHVVAAPTGFESHENRIRAGGVGLTDLEFKPSEDDEDDGLPLWVMGSPVPFTDIETFLRHHPVISPLVALDLCVQILDGIRSVENLGIRFTQSGLKNCVLYLEKLLSWERIPNNSVFSEVDQSEGTADAGTSDAGTAEAGTAEAGEVVELQEADRLRRRNQMSWDRLSHYVRKFEEDREATQQKEIGDQMNSMAAHTLERSSTKEDEKEKQKREERVERIRRHTEKGLIKWMSELALRIPYFPGFRQVGFSWSQGDLVDELRSELPRLDVRKLGTPESDWRFEVKLRNFLAPDAVSSYLNVHLASPPSNADGMILVKQVILAAATPKPDETVKETSCRKDLNHWLSSVKKDQSYLKLFMTLAQLMEVYF